MHRVFVTGGTGYIGQRVLPELMRRRLVVSVLVRRGSETKLPPGCEAVIGNALDGATFAHAVQGTHTFLQLVGTPRPSPAKAAEFERVDLASVRESARVAKAAGVSHFVYLSVAQPSNVMRAYVNVRERAEALIRETGMNATFLRPWYVLGPGHRWPYLLVPLYWLLERIPATRERAQRLGLVTLRQMVDAIVASVEQPAVGVRIVTVTEIRGGALR